MKYFYELSEQINSNASYYITENTIEDDIKHYIKREREMIKFFISCLKSKEAIETYVPVIFRKLKNIKLLKKIRPMVKENEKRNKENEIKKQINIEENKKDIEYKLNNGYVKSYEDNEYVILDKYINERICEKTIYKVG